MALWRIQTDTEHNLVTLTYFEPSGAAPKQCGRSELVLLGDLEAWVFEQADPWDRVQTGASLYVRQPSPAVAA